jgi:hypothetical protein
LRMCAGKHKDDVVSGRILVTYRRVTDLTKEGAI